MYRDLAKRTSLKDFAQIPREENRNLARRSLIESLNRDLNRRSITVILHGDLAQISLEGDFAHDLHQRSSQRELAESTLVSLRPLCHFPTLFEVSCRDSERLAYVSVIICICTCVCIICVGCIKHLLDPGNVCGYLSLVEFTKSLRILHCLL